MSSSSELFLHDHPVSSYAQKIRIALREKNLPFRQQVPAGLGSGQPIPSLQSANIRLEVPALEDGDLKIFDSTIILEYLEDKYPTPALRPASPAARARSRMIEDVCDTTYEAINWAYGEVTWFKRAEGELKDKMIAQVQAQTKTMLQWLTEQLGAADYFEGEAFGYADVCVAPIVNRSVFYGFGPEQGSPLQQWHARVSERDSVKKTFEEMLEGTKIMAGRMADGFSSGGFRREYRDHRLEFMVKSGGVDIVLEGIKKNTIRFGWPEAE